MTIQLTEIRLRGEICFVLLLLLLCLNPPTTNAQTQANQTTVAAAVRAGLGPSFEGVTAFHPFFVTGDFNGDNVQDLCVVVRIKQRSAWPKELHLLDPFQGGPMSWPKDLTSEPKLALAIIHSWLKQDPTRYLLIGESPILILEADRMQIGIEDRKNLIELMSRTGKRRRGQHFPRTAKGDVILMTTEVGGDSMLYWNGRTYRWEDSPDD
jgi:hypothetical protein